MKELIHCQNNHHFCIKNAKIEEVLKCIETSEVKNITFDDSFDWAEIYKKENTFLLIETSFDWSYIVCTVDDFKITKKLAVLLSESLNTEVNYFFTDPWYFSSRWIHTKNGKIIRSFYEKVFKVIEQSGSLSIEDQIRDKFKDESKDTLWEKVYLEMTEALNPTITSLNKEGAQYNAIRIKVKKEWLDALSLE